MGCRGVGTALFLGVDLEVAVFRLPAATRDKRVDGGATKRPLVGKQVGRRGAGGGEPQELGLVRGAAARDGQVSGLRAPSVPCTALAIPRSVCVGGGWGMGLLLLGGLRTSRGKMSTSWESLGCNSKRTGITTRILCTTHLLPEPSKAVT